MSFKLGAFDSNSIPFFKAILKEWPAVPSEVRLDDLPGGDGALFAGARMESAEWEFDLEVRGANFTEVMARADAISKAINPVLRGMQNFIPNGFAGWTWRGVAEGSLRWERDSVIWFSDQGVSVLHGTLTIVTPDPYGYKAEPLVTVPAPSFLNLVSTGNAGFYPVIEFRGFLSSFDSFNAGGVVVTGPLLATQTMVLDFQKMEFYIKTTAGGAKVRNIGERITNFTRLFGIDALNVAVSITGGTFTQATGLVNSRRV